MSNRYCRLVELMQRSCGCGVQEAATTLGVTIAGARGMIRDIKRLLPVETVYGPHGGRGRGRIALHFLKSAHSQSKCAP